MIESTDYGYAVSCDFCSEEIELQLRDFDAVIVAIKRRGWRISNDDRGQWQHKCPVCVEDGK